MGFTSYAKSTEVSKEKTDNTIARFLYVQWYNITYR